MIRVGWNLYIYMNRIAINTYQKVVSHLNILILQEFKCG